MKVAVRFHRPDELDIATPYVVIDSEPQQNSVSQILGMLLLR